MSDPQTIEGARAELQAMVEYKAKCNGSATRQMAERRIKHLIRLIAVYSSVDGDGLFGKDVR